MPADIDPTVTDAQAAAQNRSAAKYDTSRRARADFQLWSWDDSNRMWLAVSSGTEDEMQESQVRKYRLSREHGITGAAFHVSVKAPTLGPRAMGLGVVADPEAAKPEPPSPSADDVQRRTALALRDTATSALRQLTQISVDLHDLADIRTITAATDLLDIAQRAVRSLHRVFDEHHHDLEEKGRS